MNIHEDFEEFLRLLAAQKVDFVIVGGYAVAFHGYVRATKDMDILLRCTKGNARKAIDALRKFGLSAEDSLLDNLCDPGSIVRIGIPPIMIEMINQISGLSFDEVWNRRIPGHYGNVPVSYISHADLLANKKAAGRPKDLADFDELGGNRDAPS